MWMYLYALLFVIVVIVIYALQNWQYKKTEYYEQTKNSYLSVLFDKGRLGEFYTYKDLKPLDGYKRYLFNLYIPKDNGETTELDVVLLHESGIYVFESKNYSGWIFGTETQKYWTQTLPAGRGRSLKNKFFNPIMQNKGHIKWLQAFLVEQALPFYSYIVFSDRCILKDIKLTSADHYVMNRHKILSAVRQNMAKVGKRLSPQKLTIYLRNCIRLHRWTKLEKWRIFKIFSRKHKRVFCSPPLPLWKRQRLRNRYVPAVAENLLCARQRKGNVRGNSFWGAPIFRNAGTLRICRSSHKMRKGLVFVVLERQCRYEMRV